MRGFDEGIRFSGHSLETSQYTVHPQTNGMNPAARISSATDLCSTAAFNHSCQALPNGREPEHKRRKKDDRNRTFVFHPGEEYHRVQK
jgi:hypothetical protein